MAVLVARIRINGSSSHGAQVEQTTTLKYCPANCEMTVSDLEGLRQSPEQKGYAKV